MTIPVVRKRAKHSKTRGGCRTCRQRHVKCDETRPTCLACFRSKRECAGYDHVPSPNQEIRPRRIEPATAIERLPLLPYVELHDHETASLDFFRTFTIHQLPQKTWWHYIVIDLCRREPILAHAATALGSMHRAIAQPAQRTELAIDQNQRDFATTQYGAAVTLLRRYIERYAAKPLDQDQLVVVLVSCLLFFCFEAYIGNDDKADLHLQRGLCILHEQAESQSAKGSDSNAASNFTRALGRDHDRVISTTTSMRSYVDALKFVFVLLDSDRNMVDEEEPYLSTMCIDSMPITFQDVATAHIHLDFLGQRASDVWRELATECEEYLDIHQEYCEGLDDAAQGLLLGCITRIAPILPDGAFSLNYDTLRRDLRAWLSAFATAPVNDKNRSDHLLCQIYFFYIWYRVETWRDASETLADRFEGQYHHITDLAEQYLALHTSASTQYIRPCDDGNRRSLTLSNTPPLFSFGTNFVSAIMLIAVKCRTSSVRRRCIAVIRSLNLQGVFDSAFLASYLEAIVDMEEERARTISGSDDISQMTMFEAHQIPEEARLFEPMMLPGKHVQRNDFYAMDTGKMLCARMVVDTERGDCPLTIREHTFVRTGA